MLYLPMARVDNEMRKQEIGFLMFVFHISIDRNLEKDNIGQ